MNSNKETKKEKIALIIIMIVTLVGIVSNFFHVDYSSIRRICIGVVYLIIYGFVAYYGFYGYKKPHGNTLRWIILAYALSLFTNFQAFVTITNVITKGIKEEYSFKGEDLFKKSICMFLMFVAAILVAYMAGRLHKIKSNTVIMIIVLVCMIARLILASHYRALYASNISLWVTICASYYLRYRLHKQAGIDDAPKN